MVCVLNSDIGIGGKKDVVLSELPGCSVCSTPTPASNTGWPWRGRLDKGKGPGPLRAEPHRHPR